MTKRLTAFFIILALGAGVASGAPLRTGAGDCDMGDSMSMMECCKRARMKGETPDVQAARLCCAVNCQNGGASSPASSTRVSPPQVAPAHPSATVATIPRILARERYFSELLHPTESPPAYLLNLSFLN